MKRSCVSFLVVALAVLAAGLCPSRLSAQTSYIYANNGDPAKPSYVYQIDLATGAVNNTYTNLDPTSINGTGVAVVSDFMWYTASTSNCIYQYFLIGQLDAGCWFKVPGETHLGSLAYDGQSLWVVGASDTVYKCSTLGNCAAVFTQTTCLPFLLGCDALEYFTDASYPAGALISKGAFGPPPDNYDVYNLTGGLNPSPFLLPKVASTGVAWDGTNFYTADASPATPALEIYTNTGGTSTSTLALTNIPSGYPANLQDLSINYGTLPCHNPAGVGVGAPGYDNGPVNGTDTDIMQVISFGNAVSNSFVVGAAASPASFTSVCVGLWTPPDSTPLSVDWSITTPAGTLIASGTAEFRDLSNLFYLFSNKNTLCSPWSCDVYQAIITFNPALPPLAAGTYYLTLQNGYDAGGDLVFWDRNYGNGCTSKLPKPGCPSTAVRFDNGLCSPPKGCSIPSESFTLR